MKLSAQQHAVLTAICDTFAPRAEGWPSASDLGIPGAIAEAMDFNPRKAAHKQFLQLLDIWDSRAHALLTVGKTARFSQLSEAARQRMLLAWADSSIGRRREKDFGGLPVDATTRAANVEVLNPWSMASVQYVSRARARAWSSEPVSIHR